MKNKIIALFVCMLLIPAAVPVVTSFQPNPTNTAIPSTLMRSLAANWTEDYKITAADGSIEDFFGCAVSLYGDLAVIGAPHDDQWAGSVYVYHQTGSTWTQQAKLLASDRAMGDLFGQCVEIEDEYIMVGAPGDEGSPGAYRGAVYVFRYTGGIWAEVQKLIAFDGVSADEFGYALSLDGDLMVIGAPGDDAGHGSAYVYGWDGTSWFHIQKIYPSGTGETCFGFSVSLDDESILVGAPQELYDTGFAYYFIRPGVDWLLQQRFTGSDTEAHTYFGYSVSFERNEDNYTAVIGVPWDIGQGIASGSVYVFTHPGNHWDEQAKLLASDGGEHNIFGYSVALSGDTVLIGADCEDFGEGTGSVYVFTRDDTNWSEQQKILTSDGEAGDCFGGHISFEGNHALIGATGDKDHGNWSGSAYVFSRPGASNIKFNIIGGLGVNLKITNNKTEKSTVADWQINVKGGILGLINTTINGTIDIPAGGSEIVGTGIFFGLGSITITAKVADEEKIAEGTQIIILSMVK